MGHKMGLGAILRTVVDADLRARRSFAARTDLPGDVQDQEAYRTTAADAPHRGLDEDGIGYARQFVRDPREDPHANILSRATETGAAKDYLEAFVYLGCLDVERSRVAAASTLARFGSLGAAIAASPAELTSCEGVCEKVARTLNAIHQGLACILREPLQLRINLSSDEQVLDYLGFSMKHERVECLRLLFLDRKNGLIRDEVMHYGTIDHVPLYPREVIKRALEVGASALLIAHNHPSGDPTPSAQDVQMTRDLLQALGVFGIRLHEHFIIAKNGIERIRQNGHLSTHSDAAK